MKKKKRKQRKGKFPSQMKPGDLGFFYTQDGCRHIIEKSAVPQGHMLVWARNYISNCDVLITIPTDNVYPI